MSSRADTIRSVRLEWRWDWFTAPRANRREWLNRGNGWRWFGPLCVTWLSQNVPLVPLPSRDIDKEAT